MPYKGGAGPAVVGLLGGETSLTSTTVSSVITFSKAGRPRPLGVVFETQLWEKVIKEANFVAD